MGRGMTTAIDTNVIVALWNEDEAQNLAAKKALRDSQIGGGLVVCGAVYAELMAAPGRTGTFVDRFCEEAGIAVEWEIGEKVWRAAGTAFQGDRKSTRLNSSHSSISYAVFCLKKKKKKDTER